MTAGRDDAAGRHQRRPTPPTDAARYGSVAAETASLAAALAAAATLLWAAAELLARARGHAAALAAPWLALVLAAALAVLPAARARHTTLRGMRLHRARPAAVYPHRDPLLGSDWLRLMASAARRHCVLETWHALLARPGAAATFWHNSIGTWMLMTNEPENVKALLSSRFDAWSIGGNRQKTTRLALGPHAIFSANGPEWARARALIRPSFVRDEIADLACTDRHVDAFLARLPSDPAAAVDLQALLYMFTMDTSTDFMCAARHPLRLPVCADSARPRCRFGHSTDMLVSPTPDAVKFTESFEYALLSSASRARLGWLPLLLPDRRLDASVAYCKAFIDGHVAAALREGGAKPPAGRGHVFMHDMLDSGAGHADITEQLLAMILGGRDTSASTMSSMFWALARRPDVVSRLRDEVAAALAGRRPTWEELRALKYVNSVIKEGELRRVGRRPDRGQLTTRALRRPALRLWAPVAANMRCANQDTVLPRGGGADGREPLFVPRGTSCRFSMYSLHRRRDVYGDDADEFRPERWETLRPG